jgi:hypothetical protein
MKKIVFAFLVSTLTAAALAPSAAAEQLHANVVSWSPNDVQPGEPVSIVLELYTAGPSPYLAHGKPVAGVNDVQVVLHGQGQTRRFATKDLGSGRYSTEATFPQAGGWAVRVSYGPGRYGAGDEILLGKGAICVAADCVGPQSVETAPAHSNGWRWTTVALVIAAVLAVALLAAGLIRMRGGRRLDPEGSHGCPGDSRRAFS